MRIIIGIVVIALVVLGAAWLIDVDVSGDTELPEVDIQTQGGSVPDVDVDAAEVEVGSESTTVDVPSVETGTEEVTVDVPTADVESEEVEIDVPSVDVKEPEADADSDGPKQ